MNKIDISYSQTKQRYPLRSNSYTRNFQDTNKLDQQFKNMQKKFNYPKTGDQLQKFLPKQRKPIWQRISQKNQKQNYARYGYSPHKIYFNEFLKQNPRNFKHLNKKNEMQLNGKNSGIGSFEVQRNILNDKFEQIQRMRRLADELSSKMNRLIEEEDRKQNILIK